MWLIVPCLLIIIFSLGKNLNPFSNQMFEFHDETQAARVQQFTLSLKNFKFPPRLAPDFSYKMGYPVFNFYAPFSYWLTSGINLIGFDVVNSLKLSFLLSLILGFIFAYLLFKQFFDDFPSIFGAGLYATSLYFAIEILIRGNLGETWFLTLLPLSLYLIYKNSIKPNLKIFLLSVFVLSSIYTVHNLLSVLYIPISLIFALLLKNKKINFISIALGLLLSSYFLLPMIIESPLTYAKQFATLTNYQDHFLCPIQLWQSLWGYGGSITGCNDGMSFMLGKPQIIFAFFGIIFFIINLLKKKQKFLILNSYFLILLTSALFLTTYLSKPIWDLFSPILSIVQFPWRFISFSLIGLAFFGAYFFQKINVPKKNWIIVASLLAVVLFNSRYFYKTSMAKSDYEYKYLSKEYIEKQSAYKIAEYLPRTSNFESWKSMKVSDTDYLLTINTPFEKEIITQPGLLKLNIHYFPFWRIMINNQSYQPTDFDSLGRPIISLTRRSIINISYQQTVVEKISNLISLLTIIFLGILISNKFIWKKITK